MVLLSDPPVVNDPLRAKRSQERKYVFDWVFDQDSTQEEVYEHTAKQLVEKVIDGYNGTVFAYGATGSGKTHTMVGVEGRPGIMVHALEELFQEIEADCHKLYDLSMSYLEIYNENIRDLLNPSPFQFLELREDAKGNHRVVGLSQVQVTSSKEVMSLLSRGNVHRTQETTGANLTSSRSHAVLVIRVKKKSPVSSHNQQLRIGHLYMVDLAGSERAAQTQNTGKRLLEGAHINKSLLALGNCINALAERNLRYVNFRDSKLTRILKESLSGNCQTVMVSHISPSHFQYEESRNTLTYADRAKNINTKPKSNVSLHVAQHHTIIGELQQEIQSLRQKICMTEEQSKNENIPEEEEMKELKERLMESFNTQMSVRRRIMEMDKILLDQSVQFDKLRMIIDKWENEKIALQDKAEEDFNREKMPDHVMKAWEDLKLMKHQHHRHLEMRSVCEMKYQQCKHQTLDLTKSLHHKKPSSSMAELLQLLIRVYELEIEKLEMLSTQLSRDHELRCCDLMLLRYDHQRQLSENIISRQRILIHGLVTEEESENARRELDDMYHIYQQEIMELNNSDSRSFYRLTSSVLRSPESGSSSIDFLPRIPQQSETPNQDHLHRESIMIPLPRLSCPDSGIDTGSVFTNSSSTGSSPEQLKLNDVLGTKFEEATKHMTLPSLSQHNKDPGANLNRN